MFSKHFIFSFFPVSVLSMIHLGKVIPRTAISFFAAIVLERENLFLSFPGFLALL